MPFDRYLKPRRVLVIDDDEGVRRMYRRALHARFDLSVVSCLSAADACLREGQFDAIIVDLEMLGELTVDWFTRWTAEYPHLVRRTMIVSGHLHDPRFAEVVSARAPWTFEKPVRIHLLCEALDHLIDENSILPYPPTWSSESRRLNIFGEELGRRAYAQ